MRESVSADHDDQCQRARTGRGHHESKDSGEDADDDKQPLVVDSLRSQIAPMVCITPIAGAQLPMKNNSTSAVMPGQNKVSTPAAMPRSPRIVLRFCHGELKKSPNIAC